jgi:serine/threonine-protein kinase
VIHRDLKPSNIMVGSFGEVQVMDWGLAKVLSEGGVADEARGESAHETVIMTVRSGSAGSGSESQAGSVLGTPAYMAPEQARGEIERVDERADVFGLGAILCEILTGRPPFVGTSREEIRAQAARGDLVDALDRLEASGADADLIDLVRDCLAPERDRRPRNACGVARRLTGYLAEVQQRLKAAELARVEAQARAEEAQARAVIERSRRRRTVALAASVLVIAGLVGGGWAYFARQRTARLMATTRVVTDALAEAERLRGQAQSAALGDLAKWSEAIGAAKRARDLLAEGEADDVQRNRVTVALSDLEREQSAAQQRATEVERDRKLLGELETIRGNLSEHWDPKRTDADYAAAFRAFGIDLDQLDPKESGKRIAQRSAPVELASYLDHWALQRRSARGKKEEASWRGLLAAAQVADPDPWRMNLRGLIGREDQDTARRLVSDKKTLEAQPAPTLVLLGEVLMGRGDRDRAKQVLRRAWRLDPGDFWVCQLMVDAHWNGHTLDSPEEAAGFCRAAVAVRPRSYVAHGNLSLALHDQG